MGTVCTCVYAPTSQRLLSVRMQCSHRSVENQCELWCNSLFLSAREFPAGLSSALTTNHEVVGKKGYSMNILPCCHHSILLKVWELFISGCCSDKKRCPLVLLKCFKHNSDDKLKHASWGRGGLLFPLCLFISQTGQGVGGICIMVLTLTKPPLARKLLML